MKSIMITLTNPADMNLDFFICMMGVAPVVKAGLARPFVGAAVRPNERTEAAREVFIFITSNYELYESQQMHQTI